MDPAGTPGETADLVIGGGHAVDTGHHAHQQGLQGGIPIGADLCVVEALAIKRRSLAQPMCAPFRCGSVDTIVQGLVAKVKDP